MLFQKVKWPEKYTNYILQTLLFLTGVYTRCSDLNFPNSPVFDEVYYGSSCSLYFNKTFYIDEQPPLFKIILCSFLPEIYQKKDLWAHIGKEFVIGIHGIVFRLIPAVLGVLLILLVYRLLLNLKFSNFTAFITGLLITMDNGIIVQSRLMLNDSLHLFLLAFVFFLLTFDSFCCLILLHVTIGLLISVKRSSTSIWFLVFVVSLQSAWVVAINCSRSLVKSLIKSILIIISSIFIPLFLYIFIHMVNIKLLSNNGPYSTMMSSNFQASLDDGLCSTDVNIKYGDTILLRANDLDYPYASCYLQSYPMLYPLFYSDNRGSSGQQVVTCARKKQTSSQWKIVHSDKILGNVVKDKDIVWLQHQQTEIFLTTHDVAAPISYYHQEVCCGAMDSNLSNIFDWKVKIVTYTNDDRSWRNLGQTFVQLQHVATGKLLQTSGRNLPKWGKGESEVIGDVTVDDDLHVSWNAEVLKCEKKKRKNIIGTFQKALEYITFTRKISRNPATEHRFGSKVYDWPLAQTSITYWHNLTTNSHILFVGNVVSWSGGLVAVFITSVHAVLTLLCVQRGIKIPEQCHRLNRVYFMMVSAWFLQIYRHFISANQYSFSYQYLPAVLCLHILQSALLGTTFSCCGVLGKTITFIYIGLVVYCYWSLRPITYGFPHTGKQDLIDNSWWNTWEILGPRG